MEGVWKEGIAVQLQDIRARRQGLGGRGGEDSTQRQRVAASPLQYKPHTFPQILTSHTTPPHLPQDAPQPPLGGGAQQCNCHHIQRGSGKIRRQLLCGGGEEGGGRGDQLKTEGPKLIELCHTFVTPYASLCLPATSPNFII